jgi:hypothetical protein
LWASAFTSSAGICLNQPNWHQRQYLNVQQDILETFVDRGQLRNLAEPAIIAAGKLIAGLKLDHPRRLALMYALVHFAHVAAGRTFTTAEIHPAESKRSAAPDQWCIATTVVSGQALVLNWL